jgi:hypothetical protein
LTFSFPITQDGKIVFGTQYRLSPPLVFDKLRFRGWFPTMPVSRNRTRSLAKFSESVAVFPFLLPKISLQFPFPINRDDPMAFLNPSGICFDFIITDDFSAFSFPEGLVGLFHALMIGFDSLLTFASQSFFDPCLPCG